MRRLSPRKIVITTHSGTTIVGVLALSWPWSLRVRSAQVIERGASAKVPPADGLIVVPRRSVHFMQLI